MPHTPMRGRANIKAQARYMAAVVWVKNKKNKKVNVQASAVRIKAKKYREQRKFGYMPGYRRGIGSTYKMPYNWKLDRAKAEKKGARKAAAKAKTAERRAASHAAFRESMKTRKK